MGNLLKRLALDLLLPPRDLDSLIRSAPHRYKVYTIPKRSGEGRRTIAQPTPAVKELQKWVSEKVLSEFSIHPSATAYKRSSSILHNATPHAGNRYLLKLDFENFFNSITSHDFLTYLSERQTPYDFDDRRVLTSILFWRPKNTTQLILSIGAPSSPVLSNLLMFGFDTRMTEYCQSQGISYTRYADDLGLSCNEPWMLKGAEQFVAVCLRELPYPRIRLNQTKTVHSSTKSRRRITGLIITNNGEVSIGRERKRLLRAMVHRFSKGSLSQEEIAVLKGHLAFAISVEPQFLDRLRAAYGTFIMSQLYGS